MNQKTIALIMTLLLGIFIGIGALLAILTKKQHQIIDFVMGLAFSLLVMLIFTELLPESIAYLKLKNIWAFLIFGCLGVLLLKVLDNFVPDHHHSKMTQEEEKKSIAHIGILSVAALFLHNLIEGMVVYLATYKDVTTGAIMSLGIGLHNIPLGMIVTSTFYQTDQKEGKSFLAVLLLSFASFLGGLFLFFLKIKTLSPFLIGCIFSLTIGMLLYLLVFELWPRVKKSKNRALTNYGLILGVILLLFTYLFG